MLHRVFLSRRRRPLLAALFLSLIGAHTHAVPPLVTDDTGTADKGHFELYTGYQYLSDEHVVNRQFPAFELDYGITDQLEVTFIDSYGSTQGSNGLGDITLETKYNFLKDQKKLPDMAIGFEWTLPTGSYKRGLGGGVSTYYFHLPIQKTWGWFTALTDVGYTFVGNPSLNGAREDRKNTTFLGFAQEYKVTRSLNLLSELYFQTSDETGEHNTLAASLGFEKEIVKDFSLQAAVSRSVLEGARGGPDVRVYVGIHWLFPAPWCKEEKDDKTAKK